jgi:hypothetical protein
LEGDAQEPSSSYGSDLFEDWPEVNNMGVSIYVALTVETPSSRASSMANAPRDRRKSRATSFETRQPRSRAAPSWRSRQRKPEGVDVPCRRSKRSKKNAAEDASMAPLLCGGPLSVADFDQSIWEIMYPCFVEEGLVVPPGHVNMKNV